MRTPDGRVAIDPTGRMAGRGAYVCPDTDCLTIAIKNGALGRALETPLPASFLADVATSGMQHDMIEGGARGQE